MPIIIPQDIPAFGTLERENIFVMESERAMTQDIRPIEIAILNLMPTKIETETQLIRLLSNSPLQIKVTLIGERFPRESDYIRPLGIQKNHSNIIWYSSRTKIIKCLYYI